MAGQGGLSTDQVLEEMIKKKKFSGQQKREDLEKEVSTLQNLLSQEEKMHEILENVHSRNNGSAISIPNSLPPKMKELLAELAMVEDEIVRLESQIRLLQAGLKQEQELTKEAKSRQQIHEFLFGPAGGGVGQSLYTPSPSPLHRGVPERMAVDTKALHFINKAIKGDYTLKDFTLVDKPQFPKTAVDQKENSFIEETKFQDRISAKNGLLKPASPMRDFRHPTPKPRDRKLHEFLLKPQPISVPSPMPSEETKQRLEPNKLSENIMKCLNFIYIRLLRTSRVMELEKSGNLSRSLHTSINSRSFRAENGLNSNLVSQKESRQQDPYGVFDMEESIPRDIGPYKNLVRFTSSSMDPKCISSSSSVPLLKKLRDLMTNLQTVDLRFLTNQQKLAFWINMYNACIMHGFLQYGVPSTPEKLVTLMNKATLNIGGNIINTQAIEHFILRKSQSSNTKEVNETGEKDAKEAMVREIYGLVLIDPNVTFALCCGTRSSPAVRTYTADGIATELERSKLDYLQASVAVTTTRKIALPELLLRNMLDFAANTDSLVEWICHQLPTSGTLRKSLVDCFRGHGNSSNITSVSVEKIPYDYEFQYLLTM